MTGAGFSIQIPSLSRGTADRSEELRDADRAVAHWSDARVLDIDDAGAVLVDTTRDAPTLVTSAAVDLGDRPPDNGWLLGSVDGTDHWAVAGRSTHHHPDVWSGAPRPADGNGVPAAAGGGRSPSGTARRTLRQVGALLADTDAGLLTAATALNAWHRSTVYCSRCGDRTVSSTAGWSRTCPNGHQEFPRTDPAVIVLVHDGADHMVLARQPVWPAGRASVLAGFVEAGESLEGTVVREIFEEIGVHVSDPRYLGSQPWPFPRSLMVGFAARADRAEPLVPRDGEIEHARWVNRDEIRTILAAGGAANGTALPDEVSIARRMIQGWADQPG